MTTVIKYQVWAFDSHRNDFTINAGMYDNLEDAISATCIYDNSIVERYYVYYDKEGSVDDISLGEVVYTAFDSEKSELFFKQNFPHLF